MAGSCKLQVIQDRPEGSWRLTRRELVQRMLAGAAWPMVAASHPIYKHLTNGAVFDEVERLGVADWKPLFLNAQQDATLVVLADAIVPGSRIAQVNRFIDLLLSVDTSEHGKSFADLLAAFEADSKKGFRKGFPSLDAAQQNELLTDAAARPAKVDSSHGARGRISELHGTSRI
jgi:hypothetical protein